MNRWFRFYGEVLDDPKVQRLSGEQFRAWVNLLCLASRSGGKIKCEDIAFGLRISAPNAAKIMSDLGQAGLMVAYDGYYEPHNWNNRQYKSDVTDATAAERMRRKRNKDRNATVTEPVTVTPPRTDTQAEAEQKERGERAAGDPLSDLAIRAQAQKLSDECYQVLGIELLAIPPDWCGLTYQIDMMLRQGYTPPLILTTFARYAGQKPLKAMNYFVKAVESAQQNQMKPAEKMNGSAAVRSDKSAIAALDRLGDAFAAYGLREETGQAPVVQLPARRLR